jgi:diguanylate cyclase (GGDEF)-like protein/hemerythrin-like metal-binding protein
MGVKMESFKWGSHFITGLEGVDEQHHVLVDQINRFGTMLADNKVQFEDISKLLGELASYAQLHFSDEEKLMVEHQVDHLVYERHIAEHSSFIDDVVAMQREITPDTLDKTRSLLEFLTHWLTYHILGSDQRVAQLILAPEEVMSPEHVTSNSTEPLLAALNGLFEQVSRRNHELQELNQSLEEKVAERTRELEEANKHLETIALTDVLTNLPNRRHAMFRLEELWAESPQDGRPLACMMIDADDFKQINDTYGHDAGDVVLRQLARELQYAVRSDDLVCRLGGDEFLIICPRTPLQGALHLAELTRARVGELRVEAGGGSWRGSISVGVAVSSPEMASVDALIKAADKGVYSAKADGKNCVRTC